MSTLEELKKQAKHFEELAQKAINEHDMVKTKEYWKNAIAVLEAIYKMEETRLNALLLANLLCGVARLEKNVDLAEIYYRRALELYESFMRQSEGESGFQSEWQMAAIAYEDLGELREEPDCDALQKSYNIYTRLIKQFPEDEFYVDCRNKLVKRYSFLLKSAENDGKENSRAPQISKSRDDLAGVQRNPERVKTAQPNIESDSKYSKDIKNKAKSSMSTLEEQRKQAEIYGEQVEKAKSAGDNAQAKALSLKQLEILQPIAQETKDISDYKNLACCYRHLGFLAWEAKNYKEACQYYSKLENLNLKIIKAESTASNILQLAYDCRMYGVSLEASGEKEGAKTSYNNSLNMLDLVEKENVAFMIPAAYEVRAIAANALAGMARNDSDVASEKKYLEIEIAAEEVILKAEKTEYYMFAMASASGRLGEIEAKEKNIEMAERYYRKAIELLEILMKQSDNPTYWAFAAIINGSLGRLRDKPNREAQEKSRDILIQLMKRFPKDERYRKMYTTVTQEMEEKKQPFWKRHRK